MKPGFVLVLTALVTVAVTPGVAGAEGRPRIDNPMALRGEVNVLFAGLFGATDGFGGLTAAYSLAEDVAMEGTVGWGFGNVGSTGANTIAMGRYAVILGDSRAHALTFGLGPSVFFGGDYGTVWVARAEAAYELRTRSGFSLLAGGGPGIVFNDSKVIARPCEFWCLGDSTLQFEAGGIPVHMRVSIGWAF